MIKRAETIFPGSTRVPRVGEGVPPSRTLARFAQTADLPAILGVPESSSRRDAATHTRDACAPRIRRAVAARFAGLRRSSAYEFEIHIHVR